VNNVSEEEPRESKHHHRGRGRGTVRTAAMIVTIAKSDTKRTKETTVAEERKPLFGISMARTKAIGQTSVPSPLRGKKSSIG